VVIPIADIIWRYSHRYFDKPRNVRLPRSSLSSASKKSLVCRTSPSLELQLLDKETNVYDVQVVNETNIQTFRSSQISVHLPQSGMTQNTFLSYIRPSIDQEWLTVVWNREFQLTYSVLTPRDQHVPSIIERKRTMSTSQNQVEEERPLKRIRQVVEEDSSNANEESLAGLGQSSTTQGESSASQEEPSTPQGESPTLEPDV
jgi:hypothetical protein